MATGKKAFSGSSQASLISAIMKDEPPPVSAIQPVSPQALDHVVGVCLEKDPNDRWQSAHDVMVELRWIAEQGPAVGSTPAQELSRATGDGSFRHRAGFTRVSRNGEATSRPIQPCLPMVATWRSSPGRPAA